ncbi:hypothetical protein CARUB_v10024415mg [Capsella rubella]|uniref:Splicing factor YJU2 n=1 Tax=Capsella rubella TaxID=81985 RepID=R0HS90_9BRAS|nr:hypothetical protein CARUB_v10024415mg [Capsella rubella]
MGERILITFMLPKGVRCDACGNKMYTGTRFTNIRAEEVTDETYLGILYRYHIPCTNCSVEVKIKRDPNNFDFVAEPGATLLYNWRDDI